MDDAVAIAEGVRSGRLDPEDVVVESLHAIEAGEPSIQAWVHVDRTGARRAATALALRNAAALPLAGVPVGIKDIIDVAGLLTTSGAAPFAHRRAERDAEVVTRLRRAGAIIAGKTVTTEFAYIGPGPTRNPWNLAHTPGGSSSGSAAAVAAGMVPLAIGTQTVGSVLRPAAYCGVVGFKPAYGWLSTEGVTPLAWSLDHLGMFARSVADVELAYRSLAARGTADRVARAAPRPVVGVPKAFVVAEASDEVCANVDRVAAALRGARIVVEDVRFPASEEWSAAGRPVLAAEAAAYHEAAFVGHAADFGPAIRQLVESGLASPAPAYVRAQQARAALRARVCALFDNIDALLLPVAPTTAPATLASTGDPVFCAPASFSGLPAISLPSGLGEGGMPLAVQLVGRPGGELELLALAARIEGGLAFEGRPAVSPDF